MTSVADEAWFRDPALKRVLALLNADGGEARVAGGAVRNALMGLAVADVDVATTLCPEKVVERAVTAGIKAVPTGIEHGTVTLVIEGQRVRGDDAAPRYRDGRAARQGRLRHRLANGCRAAGSDDQRALGGRCTAR